MSIRPKARSNPKRKKLHTRAQCLTLAQRLCKLRFLSEHGRIWCISCGRELYIGDSRCQGGHYISRNDRATETEPDNIWPQCSTCNVLQHGNLPAYRYNLVRLIREERVTRIEDMSMARKGNEDALLRLSEEDIAKSTRKKSAKYYDNLWYELNQEIKEYKDVLGL